MNPKITKKIFRQWIIGVIVSEKGTPFKKLTMHEAQKIHALASEIIEFAEKQNLLNPDLK